MNRRTLTINRSPTSRRRISRPCCGHSKPDTTLRCVLDAGHRTRHFSEGVEWDEETDDAR